MLKLPENDPPNGLYFSERALWIECPQARPVLARLVRIRYLTRDFLWSSSNEARSTNQDAPSEQLIHNDRMHGPVRGETPGGESGVLADRGKQTWAVRRRNGGVDINAAMSDDLVRDDYGEWVEVVEVAEVEAWLWENETALALVQTGLRQAAHGNTTEGPDLTEAFAEDIPE